MMLTGLLTAPWSGSPRGLWWGSALATRTASSTETGLEIQSELQTGTSLGLLSGQPSDGRTAMPTANQSGFRWAKPRARRLEPLLGAELATGLAARWVGW